MIMSDTTIGPAIDTELLVDGRHIRLVTQGDQGPDIVLLHGVPTNAALWRNVQPGLARVAKTWAIDLPGFGSSDPIEQQGDLGALADVTDKVLQSLSISRPLFVAVDLGVLVALQWAARHPGRTLGMVLMEGFFLPMALVWKHLPFKVRLTMRLARWSWLAERVIVDDDDAVGKFVRASVKRHMTADELAHFTQPWSDRGRRRTVWFEGIHAGKLVPPSRRKDDPVDLIDEAALALQHSSFPKLLLTGTPGTVVTRAIVDEAMRRLTNLQVTNVGSGLHLLPEDQPEAVTAAVADFVRRAMSGLASDVLVAQEPITKMQSGT
jgi:haloalkane dehalogenase